MAEGWLAENIVEIFGAVTGIAYVILEIRRNILLWPLGIITSAVYIYVFGREGFYANMGLQWYYLVISIYGWYQWSEAITSKKEEARRASGIEDPGSTLSHESTEARRASGIVEPGDSPSPLPPEKNDGTLPTDVRRIDMFTAGWCMFAAIALWAGLWFILDRATDSPVPLWDGLIASLSVVATWMLTRKYIEQWYVWIFANAIAVAVYLASGLFPTAVLFLIYFIMAIIGVRQWRQNKPGTNDARRA
jgi:nicotinamide mononucleotide transporter